MADTVLIKGGTVLSCDRAIGNVARADVLIEDGRIGEVGPALRARGADVVDASDAIVMPGFVDTHRHLWRSLDRRVDATFDAHVFGAYTPDDVYAATLTGLLQAAAAGITTVVDWCDVAGSGQVDAALAAHRESGVHAVLVPLHPATPPDAGMAIAYGSPDVVAAELDGLAPRWAQARAAGQRIHAHAGTTEAAGGEVAEVGRRGLLGPDVTLTHCSRLSDADFDAVKASGAAVAITPASDMAAGVGTPPMQQLIDRGIRPGLGVGDPSLAPGDVFAQMRAANSLQHATLFDLKLAGKGGLPTLLNTRDVIRYATIDGARAAGLGDITGSLAPGKRADVVVLRTDRPNIAPVNDPIGAVVWGMDTSNVDWVFVGGNALVERGALAADVSRVRALADAARQQVAATAGVAVGTGAERS
jgi:cytosine/adenosine deaminase-related metal-dependent hydrolase